MRQKGPHLIRSHLLGVTFSMEENKAFDPVDVDRFGASAVTLDPECPPHLIEQFWARWGTVER